MKCNTEGNVKDRGTKWFPVLSDKPTTFSLFAVKKVEYCADWSEQTNQLAITFFSPVHSEKSEILC